jgi:AcrR family transcriptional regulator
MSVRSVKGIQMSERAASAPAAAVVPGTDIPAAPCFLDSLAAAAREPDLRKGERTRRMVRLATAEGLSRMPYAALSMDVVAGAAGVSRGALYQYVRSKEDAVRDVLTSFHALTIAFPRGVAGSSPYEAAFRTNRYYVDYFAKNAVFMERIRELRHDIPELLADRQRINALWAERIAAHAARFGPPGRDPAAVKLRILCLECMVDDVLREAFVIGNPAFAVDEHRLAHVLTDIWVTTLYGDAG